MQRKLITMVTLFVGMATSVAAQEKPLPSANEVVSQMLTRDLERQQSLEGYEGMRKYTLVNEYMNKRAEMVVRVSGDAVGRKHFEVVSERGWKAAQKHVLQKMLESEEETSHPAERTKTRLCGDNYDFEMVGVDSRGERAAYVIDVNPKRHEKYLFRGRIWIDAEDYALTRAEGDPAKNPSFWTKSVHFSHAYTKRGAFWFPATTESVTEARLFGTTNLTIEYFDYKPSSASAPIDSAEISKWGSQR